MPMPVCRDNEVCINAWSGPLCELLAGMKKQTWKMWRTTVPGSNFNASHSRPTPTTHRNCRTR